MSSQGTSSASRRLNSTLVVEIAICVLLIAIFCLMFVHTYEWEIEAGLFPRLISGLGMVSVLAYIAELVWKSIKGHDGPAQRILDIPWATVAGDARSVQMTAIGVIAWVLAFWIGIALVGFQIAAPLYLYSQLVVYGNIKKWIAALGAGVCLLLIIVVYDRLAETTWNDPWLFDFVRAIL
jgi:hypothetical protein